MLPESDTEVIPVTENATAKNRGSCLIAVLIIILVLAGSGLALRNFSWQDLTGRPQPDTVECSSLLPGTVRLYGPGGKLLMSFREKSFTDCQSYVNSGGAVKGAVKSDITVVTVNGSRLYLIH
jgi:hypothetical protein